MKTARFLTNGSGRPPIFASKTTLSPSFAFF